MSKIASARHIVGYTLIEILVVLFIISIVTSVALLTIGRNENKKMETFANELTEMVSLAEEQAMLQPTVLGMSFGKHSFQFASLQTVTDDKKNKWAPFQDAILNKHAIPSGIQVKVQVGNESADPRIVMSTNGDVTPFTIYIGKPGEKPSYAVIGDADGKISSKSLS